MGDNTVYPSEIFDPKDAPVFDRKTAAWIRFLARMVDYSGFFLLLYFVRKYLFYLPTHVFWLFPLEYLLFVPIEACCLRWKKSTPGKALLKIQVQKSHRTLTIRSALKRSCKVYAQGCALGFFWVAIFSMSIAYVRLVQTGKTSWDFEEESAVLHRMPSKERILFSLGLILFVFFFKMY